MNIYYVQSIAPNILHVGIKKFLFKLWQNIRNIKFTILLTFCYSSIALSTLTLLCDYHTSVSRTFLSSQTETPHTLNSSSLFPHTPPLNHHSTVHLYESDYSKSLYEWNLSICSFVTGLFHLA